MYYFIHVHITPKDKKSTFSVPCHGRLEADFLEAGPHTAAKVITML